MTIEITPELLADLRQKAENCQPQAWKLNEHGDVVSDHHTVAECGFIDDAVFIATFDPTTVLALVAEIEWLRDDLEVTKTALNLLMWDYYTTDVDEEKIEEFCKKQIELAKKYRESEAGQ